MSRITIKTTEKRFPIAPNLYGLFFEDINRAGDSGLYPEMLRNRSFEDSIPPKRCTIDQDADSFTTPTGWLDQFNHGEGLTKWLDQIPYTPIPAWYAQNAQMFLDTQDTLNEKRLVSLRVDFEQGGFIKNIGYRGVPLKKGETYQFYIFVKAKDHPVQLEASICSSLGIVQDTHVFTISCDQYNRYDCTFTANEDDFNGEFRLSSQSLATVFVGFISLMPADTYRGHGMRKDVMELLEDSNSKFLRFPGGCIVEGLTYETAMRFSDTIGPVWERPSLVSVWHYRTTNGLGFHEYLQVCEDLDLAPMYVINCGMTCQARAPEFFEEDGIDEFLQEAFDAIEYATGDVTTPMGLRRAQAGHPKPFKMSYIEIGNENYGPEYILRYNKFYNALKERYPDIQYISNYHSEYDGIPTEIADEHYYSTPEFFAESMDRYNSYDRSRPVIFVGEYSVKDTQALGSLHSALAEAIFMLGIENNQDIVRLSSFAPLFENVYYRSWVPNLICFDNHRAYGIASYYTLALLGANRGKDVVSVSVESEKLYRKLKGLPGILSAKGGLQFKISTLNNKPVLITHEVQGTFTEHNGVYTSLEDLSIKPAARNEISGLHKNTWAVFGDESENLDCFEIQAKFEGDNEITLTLWCNLINNVFRIDETAALKWDMSSVRSCNWTISPYLSSVYDGNMMNKKSLGEDVHISVDLSQFNSYKVVARKDGFDCYINNILVHQAYLPTYSAISASATTTTEEIIVKIVNFTGADEAVDIKLDCNVESKYEVDLLTGAGPNSVNSFENPKAVAPSKLSLVGSSQEFTYNAPSYSLSTLKLIKI